MTPAKLSWLLVLFFVFSTLDAGESFARPKAGKRYSYAMKVNAKKKKKRSLRQKRKDGPAKRSRDDDDWLSEDFSFGSLQDYNSPLNRAGRRHRYSRALDLP